MMQPMTAEATEVRVTGGGLRGRREGDLAVFRGIPYAEASRFGPPRPTTWEGTRPATAFGPPPPQSEVLGAARPTPGEGDNWLTANVWSPDLDRAAKLPVLIWIYGGGYVFGAADRPEYDGARLAREGRVVVVTFNYRLGVEGFAQITGAPANRGLLDQVAVLEWVRDNITAFGGDPGRVTIFGESAGGGSVAALLAMPRAAGLFRRAVAQSVPGAFFSPALAADIGSAIAGELGLRATAAEFAEAEPELLAAAADAVTAKIGDHAARWGRAAQASIPFAPVVDGDVLPVTPWQALAAGAGREIDLIAGHTRDEQRLLTALTGMLGQVTPAQAAQALEIFAPEPEAHAAPSLGTHAAPNVGTHAAPNPAAHAAPDAGTEARGGSDSATPSYGTTDPDELYELVRSDWLFRMPSLHLAEAQVAGGGRAYLYELTWSGVLGACHGLDVPLVFGNLTAGQPATLLGGSPEAEPLSAEFRAAWTSFAATGDPGWPAYDLGRRLTKIFDTPSAVAPYPEERSRTMWRDHAFAPLPLLER